MTSKDIPDSYIVVFKKHVDPSSASAHQSWLQEVHTAHTGRMELKKRSLFDFDFEAFMGLKHTFHIAGSLLGYAGHFHEDVVEQIRRHPDVSNSIPSLRELPRSAANVTQNRLITSRGTLRSVL
jgi:cerevisin